MESSIRIYRTDAGDLTVDPEEAAFLVVGAGCEVHPDDEAAVADFLKSTAAPADKQVKPPKNKAGSNVGDAQGN